MTRVLGMGRVKEETWLVFRDREPVLLTPVSLFLLASPTVSHNVEWNPCTWKGIAATVPPPHRHNPHYETWKRPTIQGLQTASKAQTCPVHGDTERLVANAFFGQGMVPVFASLLDLCQARVRVVTWANRLNPETLWHAVHTQGMSIEDAWLGLVLPAKDVLRLSALWPLAVPVLRLTDAREACEALADWALDKIHVASRRNPSRTATLSIRINPWAWMPVVSETVKWLDTALRARGLWWPAKRHGAVELLIQRLVPDLPKHIPVQCVHVSPVEMLTVSPHARAMVEVAKRPSTSLAMIVEFGTENVVHIQVCAPPPALSSSTTSDEEDGPQRRLTVPSGTGLVYHGWLHGLTGPQCHRWSHVTLINAQYLTRPSYDAFLADVVKMRAMNHGQAAWDGTVTLHICPTMEFASGYRIGRDLLGLPTTCLAGFDAINEMVVLDWLGPFEKAGRLRMEPMTGHESRLLSSWWSMVSSVPLKCTMPEDKLLVCPNMAKRLGASMGKAIGLVDRGYSTLNHGLLGGLHTETTKGIHRIGHKTLIHLAKDEVWALCMILHWHANMTLVLERPPPGMGNPTASEWLVHVLGKAKELTHHWHD